MRFPQHLQSLGKAALWHLVYSNVYIALLATAALWQSSLLLEAALPWSLIGLVFFATLAHYNLDRLLEYRHFASNKQARLQWLGQRKKALVVFTLLAVLAATYFLSLQTTAVVRWVALLVLVAIAYSFFFSGVKKTGQTSRTWCPQATTHRFCLDGYGAWTAARCLAKTSGESLAMAAQ